MITPDNQLRTRLSRLSVIQLQSKLRKINLLKLQSMTHSDQLNPRRLIRAIEVTRSLQHSSTAINFPSPNYKWIGLTAPTSILEDKIESRVISRLTPAFLKEVRYLMTQFPNWNAPAFTSTGYSFTREYILRKLSHDQVLKKWTLSEKQYAKRQLTWFKKQPHITWFQINTPSWLDQVVQEVKNWYATKDAETAPKN
jgi:tRNA dimethylallyltransferase